MISALLLLTLAQTQMDPSPKWEGQPIIRPRVDRSEGPLRMTRLGADDYAFFEAFPSSGAGTYGACPVPNWATYSEQFDNAAWSKGAFGGPAIPTVTPNQATAPDGTLSADLVSFPATAGAQDSSVFQAFGGGTWAGSVYVMGQSGSGTLDLCLYNAPTTCTPCSYTASSWTRCQVLGTPATNGNFYIGNMSSINGGTARSLNAVYLWGGMVNIGTTVASYKSTTSAAAALQPTGAKGEALTFTRASTSMCTKTTTGGLATTGIANGDLVLYPSNMSRVSYDANGTLGLLVESARTNSCLRSEEIDNAAWAQQNNVSAPIVTANAGVSPDGTTTAERVQFPATTGAQYSLIYQFSACPQSTVVSGSWYVRGYSGSGTLDVVVYSGGGYFTASCAYVSSSWTRCSLPNITTIAAVTQLSIGNGSSINGGTARSANDVLVWGAQCEAGAYATSYIPTVAAGVTRAAESGYFAASVSPKSIAATQWVPWANAPSNSRAVRVDASGSDNDRFELFTTSGAKTLASFVAVAASPQTVTTGAGTYPGSMRLAGWRTPSTTQAGIIGGVETTAVTALGALPTLNRVYIGVYTSAGFETDGIVSRVCVDPDPARCR